MHGRTIEELSNEELEYYSRQIVLPAIGYDGQLRLRNAKVCIVGLGGLGSPAALQLAAMGVGHLRLVDYDVVELSNLQRQHLYDIHSLGYAKVEVAAIRLRDLNPHVQIEPLPLFLSESNAQDIVRDMDVVVDGLDLLPPRFMVEKTAKELGIPFVYGAIAGFVGQVMTIFPEDEGLSLVYGKKREYPQRGDEVTFGNPSATPTMITSWQVQEVVKILTGIGKPLRNRLLYLDAKEGMAEVIELKRGSKNG